MAEKSVFSNITHLGIVVKDMKKTVEYLSSLGIGPFRSTPPPPILEQQSYQGKILTKHLKESFAILGNIEIRLFEPREEEASPFREFLDKKG